MSAEQVDFLFRGSHPAFYWAAALLKLKGKTVAKNVITSERIILSKDFPISAKSTLVFEIE